MTAGVLYDINDITLEDDSISSFKHQTNWSGLYTVYIQQRVCSQIYKLDTVNNIPLYIKL